MRSVFIYLFCLIFNVQLTVPVRIGKLEIMVTFDRHIIWIIFVKIDEYSDRVFYYSVNN